MSSSIEDVDISDDRISIELPNISISCSDGDDDDMHGIQDIVIDPHAEDGLIMEEAASMQIGSPSPMFRIKVCAFFILSCYNFIVFSNDRKYQD